MANDEKPNLDGPNRIDAHSVVSEALDGFNQMIDVRASIVDQLEGMEVPSELRRSHDELLVAANEWIALVGRVVKRLESADPESKVGSEMVEGPEIGAYRSVALEDRALRSCSEIQRLAAKNDVVVDLACDVWR